jgi:hypothetical protein
MVLQYVNYFNISRGSMQTYIVSAERSLSPLNLKFNQHTRATAIKLLKEAQQEFRKTVEDFAAKHPDQVIVGESAWIKVPGIGDVSEPRPIICESRPRPPKP